jgi:ABC-2 type transport system permease protein
MTTVPFRATLSSEWMKLRTLRSTWVTLVVCSLAGLGLTALTSAAVAATWREWPPEELAGFEPVLFSLFGTIAPGIALAVLAVKMVTNEYSSGMVRLTMTITPRRERVLAAKAVIVGAATLVVGGVTNVLCFAVGQAVFASAGLDAASLGDPDARRALLVTTLLGPVFPLLAVALAVLLRSTASAVTASIGLIIAPSFLGPMLPLWWQRNVLGKLPGPASDTLAIGHLDGASSYHSPLVSGLILAAWLAAAAFVAFTTLDRRDV